MTNQPNITVCLLFEQLEEEAQGKVRGEAQGGEGELDPEWALKQEREEHRRLLAESHSTSLDLRWKLQHGENRWGRERTELLEHFDRERQEWDGSMRELHRKMERVRDGRRWEETEGRRVTVETKREGRTKSRGERIKRWRNREKHMNERVKVKSGSYAP